MQVNQNQLPRKNQAVLKQSNLYQPMKQDILNTSGKKQGTISLSSEIFSAKIKPQILALYIRTYLARQRKSQNRAQTRSTITGTTAKAWRQKGTGRARHGSKKAPIFVGGSKAHGPTGTQNFKLSIPKKIKRLALFAALTSKAKNITIASGFEKFSGKTKDLNQTITTLIPKDTDSKITLILDKPYPKIIQAANNLNHLTITQATRINPYEIINSNHLLFAKESIDLIHQTFTSIISKKSKQIATDKSKSK